jgi:hypothetical protein
LTVSVDERLLTGIGAGEREVSAVEDRYEPPEVMTFSELEFEPAWCPNCVSLFTCQVTTFQVPW